MRHKIFFLIFLFSSNSVCAEAVNSKVDYAFDTSGKTALHITVDQYQDIIGMGAAYTRFTTNAGSYDSAGLQLLINYQKSNYSINGRIGIADYNVTPYFLGNISFADKISKNITLSAGITGDIVDSVKSLKTGTTVSGYNLNTDITYGRFDTLITVKQSFYSNGNIQAGIISRTHVKIIDGVYVYTSQRYIINTKISNGYFFSPPNYTRLKIGANFNQFWLGSTFYGSYDRGIAISYGVTKPVSSWKIGVERKIKKDWSVTLNSGSDLSDTNYEYHFVNIGLNHSF